jgi:hypothetical protein
MTAYFVECYWPGVDEQLLMRAAERLARTQSGCPTGVSWLGSILIPEDEIVFHLANGLSAYAVRASAQRASVPTERIVKCVHVVSKIKPRRGGISA